MEASYPQHDVTSVRSLFYKLSWLFIQVTYKAMVSSHPDQWFLPDVDEERTLTLRSDGS